MMGRESAGTNRLFSVILIKCLYNGSKGKRISNHTKFKVPWSISISERAMDGKKLIARRDLFNLACMRVGIGDLFIILDSHWRLIRRI